MRNAKLKKDRKKIPLICPDGTVFTSSHLVLAGLVQYVQGLHGHSLVVVMELSDQQLHAPAAEELHAGTQQHTEVFGGIQPARLLRATVGERGDISMQIVEVSLCIRIPL